MRIFHILVSAWVAGPALVTTIIMIGAVYVVASITDEKTEPIRMELAYHCGRDAAHQNPAIDNIWLRLLYRSEGSLDAYLQGLQAGQAEMQQPVVQSETRSGIPDTGLILDVTHALPDGRTWRNVGIVHRRDVYDPQTSPHFLAAARASNAVLTEEGLYFDEMQKTADGLGIPAHSLNETRTRIATVRWPNELKRVGWIAFGFIGSLLVASLIWLHWPWRRRHAVTVDTPWHQRESNILCIAALTCVAIAIATVMLSTVAQWHHLVRHDPAVPAVATVDVPGIRGKVDRLVQTWLMSVAEACEYDSRSMHRGVLAYMDRHPECRRLLVITGASHAYDIERYVASR